MQLTDHFYPEDNDLKRTLLRHSENVRRKALEIAAKSGLDLDLELVSDGAVLHDIGIFKCHKCRHYFGGGRHFHSLIRSF